MNQKQPQRQGQQRILVVDDEPDLTKLCSLALEYHGFKVYTSNDPSRVSESINILSYYLNVRIGRRRPFWIVLGALVYGMVNATALGLQSLGTTITFQFLLMLPYLLPIAILAAMYKKSVAPAALATPYKRGER